MRALAQTRGLGHADIWMQPALLGDGAQPGEDLLAAMIAATGFLAVIVVGAHKDLAPVRDAMFFHAFSPI
jgi:hypothetical protein